MKLILTRRTKEGKAGDIVEVSPDRAAFLLRYGLADPVTVREQAETPEKRMATKSTRAAKAESVTKEAKAAKAVRTKK
jgi:ribosomal protein L9